MTDPLASTLATIFSRWRAGESQADLKRNYGLLAGDLDPLADVKGWQETLALSRQARDEAEEYGRKIERERCARIAEEFQRFGILPNPSEAGRGWKIAARKIAEKIREGK